MRGRHRCASDAPMPAPHLQKPTPARSRAHNGKGTMVALGMQPGGPFGGPDALGAIRWTFEAVQMQFAGRVEKSKPVADRHESRSTIAGTTEDAFDAA